MRGRAGWSWWWPGLVAVATGDEREVWAGGGVLGLLLETSSFASRSFLLCTTQIVECLSHLANARRRSTAPSSGGPRLDGDAEGWRETQFCVVRCVQPILRRPFACSVGGSFFDAKTLCVPQNGYRSRYGYAVGFSLKVVEGLRSLPGESVLPDHHVPCQGYFRAPFAVGWGMDLGLVN
jgi:hypothetical protein